MLHNNVNSNSGGEDNDDRYLLLKDHCLTSWTPCYKCALLYTLSILLGKYCNSHLTDEVMEAKGKDLGCPSSH